MFLKQLKTLLRYDIKLVILMVIIHLISCNLIFAQDWTIKSVEVVRDSTIILDKNLVIKNNGHLTLSNVNLTMNCQYDGEFRIEVEPGGSFFVDSSKIQSTDADKGYAFLAAGDSLEITNSTIQHAGCGPEQEGISREEVEQGIVGLTVKSPLAIIEGNTFCNNEIGVVLVDSGIVVKNNVFYDNIVFGIYVNYGKNGIIEDNDIQHGIEDKGSSPIMIWPGYNMQVRNNYIVSSIHSGIISVFTSHGNVIEGNNLSGFGVGIPMIFVSNDNVVRNNSITVDECGIQVWGWGNTVEDNTISPLNGTIDIGIYLGFAYNNIVRNNKITTTGTAQGIHLDHSSYNLIRSNEMNKINNSEMNCSFGLLFNRSSRLNVIQQNILKQFSRGVGLFYTSDSNSVYRNQIDHTIHQSIVLDDVEGNRIYANNNITNSGEPPFHNGENLWNYQGNAPVWQTTTPPGHQNFYNCNPGNNVIENETIYLGNIELFAGDKLTIQNSTLITGANPVGSRIKLQTAGSFSIIDSKLIHLKNGFGFEFLVSEGSDFEMIRSELDQAGLDWIGITGFDIYTNNVTLKDNIISGTRINLYNCSHGKIIGNTIKHSRTSISLGNANNVIIEGNEFPGSIQETLIGGGSDLIIRNNTISNAWSTNLNIYNSSNVLSEGNDISNIHGKNSAFHLEGTNITIQDNRISNSYSGIEMQSGQVAIDNQISECTIGIRAHSMNNQIESNSILNCEIGVNLLDEENTAIKNTIANCDTGLITGYYPSTNIVYQNNFIDNTIQAFENGANIWDFNGIGNFWSDYTGVDANGDGIGDTPYNVHGDTWDHFPLMSPANIQIAPILLDVFSESINPESFSRGDTNVVIAKICLEVVPEDSGESAYLRGIRIDRSGSGQDGDISTIKVWRDSDNDEVFNTSTDSLIGYDVVIEKSASIFFNNEEIITFEPTHYFVSIDISSSISNIGNTIGFSCQDSSYFITKFPAKVKNTNFPLVFCE